MLDHVLEVVEVFVGVVVEAVVETVQMLPAVVLIVVAVVAEPVVVVAVIAAVVDADEVDDQLVGRQNGLRWHKQHSEQQLSQGCGQINQWKQ